MNTDVNKAVKSSVGMNNLGFYTREKIVITVSKAKDGVREWGGGGHCHILDYVFKYLNW